MRSSIRGQGPAEGVDHCAIYLLIAGTYTPFNPDRPARPGGLVAVRAICDLALSGVVFKLHYTGGSSAFQP